MTFLTEDEVLVCPMNVGLFSSMAAVTSTDESPYFIA